MNNTIGIIGLGRIGIEAAARYIKLGYEVIGLDINPRAVSRLESLGGTPADSPAEVARRAETVLVLVLNDEQVTQVMTGLDGVIEGVSENSLVVGMSTVRRETVTAVAARMAKAKVDYLDCPFTGGPARIPEGELTLITAGPEKVVERARPILESLGRMVVMGDRPGMAQAAKHCNQLLVTAVHGAAIELMTLADKSGLDVAQVCEVVGSGIAGNDYFKLLTKAILEDTVAPGGTALLWKDVNIVVDSGREKNLPLLVATAVSHYFNMAVAQGMLEDDSTRLMEVMGKMIGDD